MQAMEELVRVLKDGTNEAINKGISGLGIEFGTITSTGLKIDNFKYEINDYKLLDYLKMDKDYFTKTQAAGTDNHFHEVNTPEGLKPLKSGDRVIAAQIGTEFVIIGRVS